MSLNKKDILFLSGLLASLVFFYPELFLAKAASLIGDHWEQHFPWAFLLDQSLKNGKFPFWTSLIHCGFPIAAEGQIGVFYFPNLVLYLILPFKWAYAYLNVFHFFVAAACTYLYSREIKLSRVSSFISAFIFTFGTAYGGAYYNITSLKTIAWFPLCLFLFEKYYAGKRFRFLFFFAVVLSQILLAGYLQVALLSVLILGLYVFLRVFFFFDDSGNLMLRLKVLKDMLFSLLLTAIFALPQIYLTFELALRSNRVGLSEDYAYIGSMSPLAISTLLIPIAQGFCRGNCIYGGAFSVILILFGFLSKSVRQEKIFKLWSWIVLVSLLLALGRWSPLYVAIIKLTQFYSFRTPMKFLVFICFSLAILSGFGFEEALKGKKLNLTLSSSVVRVYLGIVSFCVAIFSVVFLFLTALRSCTIHIGQFIIRRFIYGHPGRPNSLEVYDEKLSAFLDLFRSVYSFGNFWTSWNVAILLVSVVFVLSLKLRRPSKTRWLVFGFIFLFVDLYTFSWFDIKKDFGLYGAMEHSSPIIDRLKQDKEQGTLKRIYGFRKPGEALPSIPSINMLYGIEDVGAYSPFILKRYYETIGTFGNVNDSNLSLSPTPEYVMERLKLLSALGVSHILSRVSLKHEFLRLAFYDKVTGSYLYEHRGDHEKAYLVTRVESHADWTSLKTQLLKPDFDPKEVLLLEQSEFEKIKPALAFKIKKAAFTTTHLSSESDREVWVLETKSAGFFVLMDLMYPGWTVTVNDRAAPIVCAYGLFKAVWLEQPGTYKLEFQYHPFFYRRVS